MGGHELGAAAGVFAALFLGDATEIIEAHRLGKGLGTGFLRTLLPDLQAIIGERRHAGQGTNEQELALVLLKGQFKGAGFVIEIGGGGLLGSWGGHGSGGRGVLKNENELED